MREDAFHGRAVGSVARRVLDRLLPIPELDQPAVYPFRPRALDEVPAEAIDAIRSVSPLPAPDRLFVIPPALAPGQGARRRCVATPPQVLAFSDTDVMLWTGGGAAMLNTIPLERVLAVDDRTILLYGRLTIIGAEARIAVPYNTVARRDLQDNVRGLRSRIVGERAPVRNEFVWLHGREAETSADALPYKWSYALRYNRNLLLDRGEPAMIAAGDVVEIEQRRRRGRTPHPATGLAALGPRELVIAAEPAERLEHGRYGVDLTTVPRRFVRDLAWERGTLRIGLRAADGQPAASIERPLDRHLADAMRRCFGDAIPWS